MADEELERLLVEVGNLLNVAGDRLVGAPARLRGARSPKERAALCAELARPLRRSRRALAIALVLLECDEGGGVTP